MRPLAGLLLLGVIAVGDPEILQRARTEAENGNHREARALLDAFLARENEGARAALALLLRGRENLAMGDTAAAADDFESAQAAAPASSSADDALLYAGNAAADAGDLWRARELYRRALGRYPASDRRNEIERALSKLAIRDTAPVSAVEVRVPDGPTEPGIPTAAQIRATEPGGRRRPGAPAPGADTAPASREVTLNFDALPIRDFVRQISSLTGRNYVLDEGVAGTVTVFSGRAIPVEELDGLFHQILESKDLAAIREAGGVWRIAPRARAVHAALDENGPFVTRLLHPEHADASQISAILRPLLAPSDQVLIHAPTNTLILSGSAENIERLAGIAQAVDVENVRVEILPLRRARADELAARLAEVANALPRRGGDPAPRVLPDVPSNRLLLVGDTGTIERLLEIALELDLTEARQVKVFPLTHARAKELGEALAVLLASPSTAGPARARVIPDLRTNSIILATAFAPDIAEVGEIIRLLDRPSAPVRTEVQVVRLQYAGAKELAEALRAVFAPPAGGQPTDASVLGPVQIAPDLPRNAILVSARPEDWERIRPVLERLDQPQAQVLVEAVFLEVSLARLRQLGVEVSTLDGPRDGSTRILAASNFGVRPAVLSGSAQGLVAGVFRGSSIGPVLQALLSQSDVDILSMPSVLATDNTEAKMTVGDLIPVVTSQVTTDIQIQGNTGVYQNINYRNVGVELKMTPHVAAGSQVTMDFDLKLETVRNEAVPNSALQLPSFSSRTLGTRAVVEDGDYVILGGLISDRRVRGRQRIPFFGDLPIVGHFFRNESNENSKTTLLVFLRPRIVSDPMRARHASEGMLERHDTIAPAFDETVDPNRLNTTIVPGEPRP